VDHRSGPAPTDPAPRQDDPAAGLGGSRPGRPTRESRGPERDPPSSPIPAYQPEAAHQERPPRAEDPPDWIPTTKPSPTIRRTPSAVKSPIPRSALPIRRRTTRHPGRNNVEPCEGARGRERTSRGSGFRDGQRAHDTSNAFTHSHREGQWVADGTHPRPGAGTSESEPGGSPPHPDRIPRNTSHSTCVLTGAGGRDTPRGHRATGPAGGWPLKVRF